jgi:hypothetical protein
MLLEILPPSDLIAVVDLHQMLKDLQPRLERSVSRAPPNLPPIYARSLARSSIDPDQLRYGLLGLSPAHSRLPALR